MEKLREMLVWVREVHASDFFTPLDVHHPKHQLWMIDTQCVCYRQLYFLFHIMSFNTSFGYS